MDSIKISGMSCQHCVASVKNALESLSGVSEVSVDLSEGRADFKNDGASKDEIKNAISQIGFEPVDD